MKKLTEPSIYLLKILGGIIIAIMMIAAFSFLTGCTTVRTADGYTYSDDYTYPERYAKNEDVMKELGLTHESEIDRNLPDGYKTSDEIGLDLRALAGIYAGTFKIIKIENGSVIESSYSQFESPEAIRKVLREADINDNMIIGMKELLLLQIKIYKEFCN